MGQRNVLSRVLAPALDHAGDAVPRVTIHGLRRTHASILAALGVSIPEAMGAMGHRSAKTLFDIYAGPFSQTGLHALVGLPEPQAVRSWEPVHGKNRSRMDPRSQRLVT